MTVLVIEDDPAIGSGIVKGLRQAGFVVDWVRNGLWAESALATCQYTLLVMDLGLPDCDGIDLLKGIRRKGSAVPILVVTARDAVDDRITGLNLGADDYLVKPFNLTELIARANALLRRGQVRSVDLRLGGLRVDLTAHTVTLNQQEIHLSPREFGILAALLEMPGAVVSLADLEKVFQSSDGDVSTNAIEVHLHRLRRKLDGKWIRNVRGVGFKIVEPA